MTSRQAVAAVQTAAGQIEVRRFPVPEPPPGGALLRVEGCGICGTDVEMFDGHATDHLGLTFPMIPGHEPIGTLESIDPLAAARWNVSAGDRVAVEPVLPCGACRSCQDGVATLCTGAGIVGRRPSYGYAPLDLESGLWGGFSQYIVLQPATRLHRVDSDVPAKRLAYANALAAGVEWATVAASPGFGDVVVVLGPGPRGVACALAAKAAGAGTVIVSGLARDHRRLEVARALGADHTVDVDAFALPAAVAEITNGRLADIVIDTTPYATTVIDDALRICRPGGTIVLAGLKGGQSAPLDVDTVAMKALHITGVRSASTASWRRAIALLGDDTIPWAQLHTHTFGLDEIPKAIDVQAGRVEGEHPMHVIIDPWRPLRAS